LCPSPLHVIVLIRIFIKGEIVMTGSPPYHKIATPFCVLLVSLTVTAAPAHAGLLDKVKSIAPRLASGGLIKAIGDYTGGILEEGTKLVKEGLSGNIDSATYSRRHDEFLDKKVHLGVKSFLKDAADNLKLKVANPLAGVKERLGDTRLSKLVSRVQEKIQGTTADSPATDATKPDEQDGTIDPRIALAVNDEETEWYEAETSLMDETPLPQAEAVAHVDNNRAGSPDSDWSASGEGDGKGEPVRPDCKNPWVDIDADCGNEDQATAQARDPWTDLDDGADEWADSSTPDCKGPWVDIDADCGNENQGNDGRSEETEVAGVSDEAQEGTYQEAVDRLLGNEPASDADPYSASGEGYEEAVAQLEAEAAERERLAQLAAEAAERERQARLAAEAAEREQQARLAVKRAERERQEREYYAELEQLQLEEELSRQRMQQDYNSSVLGQFNNMMNGIMGMAPTFPSGGVASRPSSNCQNLDQEVSRELNAMNLEGGGMCQNARTYIRVLSHVKERLSQYGCYNGEYEHAIQQAQQSARAACH
jgi:hypothetical protein